MQYSFVIPTFNRPDEVTELLESACILAIPKENFGCFEMIFADGSPTDILRPIIEKYTQKLNIQHLHCPKLAISPSRNLGAENAKGEYLIFLDSDVILPEGYMLAIHEEVSK